MGADKAYQPPQAELIDKRKDLSDVLKVAKRQKLLLMTFLSYLFLAMASSMFLPTELQSLAGIAVIVLALAMVILTGALSWLVYGKALTVFFVLLSIVPLVNLLVVLAINARASKKIKESGFKVGFLGANTKSMALAAA